MENFAIEEGISIITIVLNGEKFIEETIQSVIDQNFEKLDYIIIDGGSTDRTIEIIQKYSNVISRVISEPDGGIYHAINKGIATCRYSVVGAIHCGDKYSKGALKKVFENYKQTNADIIYGDIYSREDHGSNFILRRVNANHTLLIKNMSIFHPATFVKLSVYRSFGLYDCKYRSASDYDLLLRLYNAGYKFSYISEVFATFRSGGTSSDNFLLSFMENLKIRLHHQGMISSLYYGFKTIPVILFYRLRRGLLMLTIGERRYFEIKREKINKCKHLEGQRKNRGYNGNRMVNFFDDLYANTLRLRGIFIRLKVDSLFRFIIRLISNVFIPCYYNVTGNKRDASLCQNANRQQKLIVTLTSFPGRIRRTWLVVESILRQSLKPDKIVLWLSKNQFNSIDHLPTKLLNQRKRGLEIRLVDDDIRSHKKYYYALREFPEDYLITIDDDIFYQTNLIEDLYKHSLKFPGTIITQYGFQMEWVEKELKPYAFWERKTGQVPSSNIFFGSGGGTILPPNCFSPLAKEVSLFMSITPFADDIWLNAMCRLKDTKVMTTSCQSILLPVVHCNSSNLYKINNGLNDKQLNDLRLFLVNNYNLDPFQEDKGEH